MTDRVPPVILPSGTILTGNGSSWEIGKVIGQGSFGTVFECRSTSNYQQLTISSTTLSSSSSSIHTSSNASKLSSLSGTYPYVMKLAALSPVSTKSSKTKKSKVSLTTVASNMMYKEYILYNVHFRSFKYLPTLPRNAYGTNNDNTYVWLVLPRYEYTLRSCIEPWEIDMSVPPTSTLKNTIVPSNIGSTEPIIPWSTICAIMIQMIDVLEHIHRAGYVYVDINADNIMIGKNPTTQNNQIYLIDMGLTTQYKTFDGLEKPATVNGTPMFITSSAARQWPMSPRDDLESLGYLLLYMLRGKNGIPWKNVQNYDTLGSIKLNTSVTEMINGLQTLNMNSTIEAGKKKSTTSIHTIVQSYLTTVRNLAPTDTINYSSLRLLFQPYCNPQDSLYFRTAVNNPVSTKIVPNMGINQNHEPKSSSKGKSKRTRTSNHQVSNTEIIDLTNDEAEDYDAPEIIITKKHRNQENYTNQRSSSESYGILDNVYYYVTSLWNNLSSTIIGTPNQDVEGVQNNNSSSSIKVETTNIHSSSSVSHASDAKKENNTSTSRSSSRRPRTSRK